MSINIYNNYDAPIQYAVDSSPVEAIEQFTITKQWMESNNLTKGNTCVIITTNPNCELSNYYNNRVLLSSEESNNVNVKDTFFSSCLFSLYLNKVNTVEEYLLDLDVRKLYQWINQL